MKSSADKSPVSTTDANHDWSVLPILLIGLLAIVLYWGLVYLENHAGGFDAQVYAPYDSHLQLEEAQIHEYEPPYVSIGKKVFVSCAACHQGNAVGVPGQFPPLAGSDWVNVKAPDRMIRIVLNGVMGPITVNGQAYNNAMPAWKTAYSDEEIAAVITYVRSNKAWNNTETGEVTADQVKKIRAEIKARDAQFTAEELLKVPVN